MNTGHIAAFVLAAFVTACNPSSAPTTNATSPPPPVTEDAVRLRRAVGNIESYLVDLEGHLRISRAQTWSQEASAAQHALGNIRLELDTLKQAFQNVGDLESWLTDLEGRLRGASAENWSLNAPAAQHIVGNVRVELQTLTRRLQDSRQQR